MTPTAAIVGVALVFGLATALIGKGKGNSFWLWFAVGTFLPGVGFLAAVLARDETRELRRRCPRCTNVVPLSDTMCMRCGQDLDFPDEVLAPPASGP